MPKAPKQAYSAEAMERALAYVQLNNASVRAVTTMFGVPRSSLQFKIKNPGHKDTFGPTTVLSDEEEGTLVRWIIELSRKGFPRKKEDLKTSVQQFLVVHPRPNTFRNNGPGDGWVKAFLRRHPEVTERTSEAVTAASSCVSEKDIRGRFREVQTYIDENHLAEAMSDPSRVFNGDESIFQICPSTGKVLAPKGSRNVYSVEQGASKDNLTVMFTFSASGLVCCPMIVYAYQRIPEKIAASVPNGWGVGRSDSGWMTAEVFYEYISNVFHPFLLEQQIKFPVVLYVDGHKTHLTFQVSQLCSELKIELIALYPNATRILQPADVSAFHPLKVTWRKAVREWYRNHPGEVINKANFAPILKEVVHTSIKPESLINGFRICGLYPFDPNAVDYTKCLGSSRSEREAIGLLPSVRLDGTSINYEEFSEIVGAEKIKQFETIQDIMGQETNNEEFIILFHLWRKFQAKNVKSDRRAESLQANSQTSQVIPQNIAVNLPTTSSDTTSHVNDEHQLVANPNISNTPTQGRVSQESNKSSVIRVAKNDHMGEFLVRPETPKRKGKRMSERFPFAITSQKYKLMYQNKQEAKIKAQEDKEERKRKREEKKCMPSEAKKSRRSTAETSKRSEPAIGKECSPTEGQTFEVNTQTVKSNEVLSRPTVFETNATSGNVSPHQDNSPTHLNYDHAKRRLFSQSTPMKACVKCCICKRRIVLHNSVACDFCHKTYHRKCIPKYHQIHIPESDEEDFLCHYCYKENDSDSTLNCEVSSDDELYKLCKLTK